MSLPEPFFRRWGLELIRPGHSDPCRQNRNEEDRLDSHVHPLPEWERLSRLAGWTDFITRPAGRAGEPFHQLATAPNPSTSPPSDAKVSSPTAVSQADRVSSTPVKFSFVSICFSDNRLPSPNNNTELSMFPGVN